MSSSATEGQPPGTGLPSVQPVVAANAEHDANRELINEVIFLRDLDEVHLLLDFISGRTDKTLNDFEITLPDGTAMQGAKLIEELTKIRYPTPVGRDRAHDAALLLCAKDRLTAMASPARGMTIAFTAMLVGLGTRESGKINDQSRPGVRDILASWFDWVMARLFLKSSTTDTARRHEETDTSGRHSRVALAREAFPWLVPSVRRMQRMLFLVMSFLFVIWLPLLVLTYWDVTFGKTILQRAELAERDRVALHQAAPTFETATCVPAQGDATIRVLCARLAEIAQRRLVADTDLGKFLDCAGWGCTIAHPIRWPGVLWAVEQTRGVDIQPGPRNPTNREALASAILFVFGSYVLPMMFGVVGAGVRILRGIQERIRLSLLGPRDVFMTLTGLLIGCVAGLAVGLYLSPSDAGGAAAGSLTLTASGLSFLAGYGSDDFFKMLDKLLSRIFGTLDAETPTPGTSPPVVSPTPQAGLSTVTAPVAPTGPTGVSGSTGARGQTGG